MAPSTGQPPATLMGLLMSLVTILFPFGGNPTKPTCSSPSCSMASHGMTMLTDAAPVNGTIQDLSRLVKTALHPESPCHSASKSTFTESDPMPPWITSSFIGWEISRLDTLSL